MKAKKKWSRGFCMMLGCVMMMVLFPMTAFAEGEGVAINETNFPDEKFIEIVKGFDDGDNILNDEEIGRVTQLNCNNKGISSLKGIEFFTALEKLSCSSNRLEQLDVSANTKLEYLACDFNQLKSLDVSANTALKTLSCSLNQLTGLDVTKNVGLTSLYCDTNQLNRLDLSKNVALTVLSCNANRMIGLDVSKNTALTYLACGSNRLSSLDVSKNTKLTTLWCYSNQLTDLDISKNTALTDLSCDTNKLTKLNVGQNTELERLTCDSNQLSSLDLSENTKLEQLSCRENQLGSLDVSLNTEMKSLACGANKLTSLDVSRNADLEQLTCEGNALTELELGDHATMKLLNCHSNQLESLDISKNIGLKTLYCYDNQLSELDLSKNLGMEYLDCGYNQLTKLDVSTNTALESLYCKCNRLTSLDVSRNSNLKKLGNDLNIREIDLTEERTFELSDLPDFEVNKAGDWIGATVNGTVLQVNADAKTIVYTYDCGNKTFGMLTFGLRVGSVAHTCVFDQEVVKENALMTPADCTNDAVYYLSCSCGAISTEETDTFTAEDTALGHDYSEEWCQDDTMHWHECSRCREKEDEEEHAPETTVTPASMTRDGKAVTSCSVCEKITDTTKIASIKTVELDRTIYVYDGKVKTPKLTVKDSTDKVIPATYYTVKKTAGCKNVGQYTYKITFKGNYKGTKSLNFTINPKGTTLVSVKAESKGFIAKWKKQATQTTGYEIRFATNQKMDKAKTVKIAKNNEVSKKITKLAARKKYYVQIRTYKKVGSKAYYSGWSKTKTVTTGK